MNIFFDLLISLLIVMTALPAVILLYHRQRDNHSWERKYGRLSLVLIVILFFGLAVVLYGSFIEPRLLVVTPKSLDLARITEPIKIAFVADFQVGPYKQSDYMAMVVDKIVSLKPDLVLIGGDHINNSGNGRDETVYLEPLARLAERFPTYAIHGNHEYGVSDNASFYDPNYRLPDLSRETRTAMEELGIKYLVNQIEILEINGQKFNLFGGDCYWAQKLDLAALKTRNVAVPTIALIHNPAAIFDVDGYGIDLMLSGHTHGGQIRLPFIGPVVPVDNVVPRLWHKGWVKYDQITMYVTSGAGETGTRARLLTPPEIVLLTIY